MKTLISTALLPAWGVLYASAQVADVHSHYIPGTYTDFLRAHHAELQETFPLPKWDADSHLAFMDEMGIDGAVLSLPAPPPYFGDSAESAANVRQLNGLAAKLRDEHPDRFKFLATLPLPDVQAAVKEAEYAFEVLHADGIKLAGNSAGQYVGDADLDALMEVLDEKGKIDYTKLKPILFEMPTYAYLKTGDIVARGTEFGRKIKQQNKPL